METVITPEDLKHLLRTSDAPLLIDVRRRAAFLNATCFIEGALIRNPEQLDAWVGDLPPAKQVLVYCVHGHEVSQNAAAALRERGIAAAYLEGGIAAWDQAGGAQMAKPAGGSTLWVTRERPRIDRIACPWLIKRLIDADAAFLYVSPSTISDTMATRSAIPYDTDGAFFGHHGEACSFDAFVKTYRLFGDAALMRLAAIVRAADTGHAEQVAQAPGLLAQSIGLAMLFRDDYEMLHHGMVMYDALYAWCGRAPTA